MYWIKLIPTKGLACLVVTVTNLGSKVDGGFKRLDNWMKFLLGIFVTTVCLACNKSATCISLTYLPDCGEVRIRWQRAEKDIKGDLKVEAIGLKSEILPKLSRMVKVEAIGLKSEILLELSRMELRLSGNIGKAGAKDEAKRSG